MIREIRLRYWVPSKKHCSRSSTFILGPRARGVSEIYPLMVKGCSAAHSLGASQHLSKGDRGHLLGARLSSPPRPIEVRKLFTEVCQGRTAGNYAGDDCFLKRYRWPFPMSFVEAALNRAPKTGSIQKYTYVRPYPYPFDRGAVDPACCWSSGRCLV